MSYGVSAALQAAIYDALGADSALAALVGTAIYDAIPSGTLPTLYVALGAETVRAAGDQTGNGTEHLINVEIHTDVPGFAAAKAAAGAVSDVLHRADLTLTRGRLIYLNFDRASAARVEGATGRVIELRFKARIEDD